MSIPLKIPSLGESVTQATVGVWLKKEGDPVQADEPLVEVESEKATVALPAPAAGVLRKVLRNTGDTVAVGVTIGEMEEGAPAQSQTASPAGSGPAAGVVVPAAKGGDGAPGQGPTAAAAARPTAPPPTSTSTPTSTPTSTSTSTSTTTTKSTSTGSTASRAPPSARRLMAERGVSAGDVRGSGPGGQIRKEDVVRALEAPPPAEARGPAPAPPTDGAAARERVVPMTVLRRTVARRLVEAQHTAAILTTFNEVDMSRVLALRERHGEAFHGKHGVKLGFMSFFVKAAVEALRAFPTVNAEVRGTDVVYKDHYDIGVAVGGGKGLVVPVVRDADALSFAEIEKAVADLARRARENRITMDDLEGGTFTISNGGIYGSLLSTPILNPPQSGILGLHK